MATGRLGTAQPLPLLPGAPGESAGTASQDITLGLLDGGAALYAPTIVGGAVGGIQFVQELGGSGSSASGTSQAITLGVNTTVGNHVIVYAGGGGAEPTSVTDSRGNAYTKDTPTAQAFDPRTAVFSAKIAVGKQLVSGDSITVNYAASTSTRVVSAAEFSGLDPTSWVDVGEEGGTGGVAANAVDSGATATTAQANELVAGDVMHASTVTAYAPEVLSPVWQSLTTFASTVTVRTLHPHYRIVSATGAMAMKATWTGTARTTGAAVATYKAAAGASPQTITLGLLDASATLYAPNVSQDVTLGLLDAGAALYAPTVAPKSTITVGLLDGSATLFAPTLAPKSAITLGLLGGAGATPALVQSKSGTNSVASQTLTLDAAPTPGNVLVAGLWRRRFGSMTPDTGWTEITDGIEMNPTASQEAALYIKVVPPGDTAAQSIGSWSGTPAESRITIAEFSGLSATPLDQSDLSKIHLQTSATSQQMTVTPTAGGPILLIGIWHAVGTVTYTSADSIIAQGLSDSGFSPTGMMLYRVVDPATGAYTLTGTASPTTEWGGALVSLLAGAGTQAALYAPTVTAAPLSVTLGLLDGSATLYTPTVIIDQFVTLGLLDGVAALYAPTVIIDQFVTLGLLDGTATLYAPTVTAGPLGVTLPVLDGVATLYTPTVIIDQFVTLGLLDGVATLYTPTLAPGPVGVSLGLLDGVAALYAPAVLPSQPITLGLLDGSATLYAPTVAPQPVGVTIPLLDAGAALYAPQVQPDQFVTLGLLDGTATLYAPTLQVGALSITPPLLDGVATLYSPTLAPKSQLTLSLLDGGAALYAPTVTPTVTISTGLLDGNATLYSPTFTVGSVTVTLPQLDGSATLYAPTITSVGGGSQTLTLTVLDEGATTYAPLVAPLNRLTVPLLDGVATLYTPSTKNVNTIPLGLLDGSASLSAPTLYQDQFVTLPVLDGGATLYDLSVTLGAGPQTVGLPQLDALAQLFAPALAQAQFLTFGLLDAAPAIYSPTLGRFNTVTTPLLDSGATLYTPTVTTKNGLTVPLIDGNAVLYGLSLTSASNLVPPLLQATNQLYSPSLTTTAAIVLGLLDGQRALYMPSVSDRVLIGNISGILTPRPGISAAITSRNGHSTIKRRPQ